MLFESISYSDELPFEMSFVSIGEESRHCHKEIEILLVLRGTARYRIYHSDYRLTAGDLIISDVEDLHQIHDSSEDVLLLSIHIDTRRFEHLYPNIRYMFFVCEECMDGPSGNKQLLQSKLVLLKHHIAKLAFDYMRENKDTPVLTEGINELVSILVHHFQGFFMEDFQYKASPENMSSDDLQRLCRITRYIKQNYKEKISLDDVSEMEHLSSYYVSHLIKENLGFNFQSFLNTIRLEYAEKLLVFSNMTLMQISQDCGFSSPNYFNKCFSALHGTTPSQYRKAYIPCERSSRNNFTRKEAFSLLVPYFNVSKRKGEQPRHLTLTPDFKTDGFRDFWSACAPRIVIDSLEAALMLGICKEDLLRIRPAAFILDEGLCRRNRDLQLSLEGILEAFPVPLFSDQIIMEQDLIHAFDLSAAASQIFNSKRCRVSLTGQTHSLFTEKGLKTPIYSLYDFFADLKEPQIKLQENCILIKSQHALAVILFNTQSPVPLSVHLSTEHLPDGACVIRRTISGRDSCYSVMETLKDPESVSPLLKKRIQQGSCGKAQFTLLNKTAQPHLDLMIYSNTAVILELPTAT